MKCELCNTQARRYHVLVGKVCDTHLAECYVVEAKQDQASARKKEVDHIFEQWRCEHIPAKVLQERLSLSFWQGITA